MVPRSITCQKPVRLNVLEFESDDWRRMVSRFFKSVFAFVALSAAMPVYASTYVLQFGINDYPGTEADLRGCVNDVTEMRSLLESQFAVPSENFKTLTDAQVNRDGFLGGVKWLIEQVKAGDQVIVQYSGHGGQLKTGDVVNEPDGFEEVIALADDSLIPGKFFRDWADDLKGKGVNATFVIDSCYSGGMSRPPSMFEVMGKSYGIEKHAQRTLGNVTDRAGAKRVSDMDLRLLRATIRTKIRPALQGSWAFMMAAMEDQTSADLQFKDSTPAHGAFTFILLAALRDMKESGIKDIVDVVKQILDKNELKQGPNSEFSNEERASLPFVLKG